MSEFKRSGAPAWTPAISAITFRIRSRLHTLYTDAELEAMARYVEHLAAAVPARGRDDWYKSPEAKACLLEIARRIREGWREGIDLSTVTLYVEYDDGRPPTGPIADLCAVARGSGAPEGTR